MNWQWQWRPRRQITQWEFFFGVQALMWTILLLCGAYLPAGWEGQLGAFCIGVLSSMLIGKWGRWW